MGNPTSLSAREQIAQRLRRVRKVRDLTQAQTAEVLGCSVKRYSDVERGKAELWVSELQILACTLDVPVAYFFGEIPEDQVILYCQ